MNFALVMLEEGGVGVGGEGKGKGGGWNEFRFGDTGRMWGWENMRKGGR